MVLLQALTWIIRKWFLSCKLWGSQSSVVECAGLPECGCVSGWLFLTHHTAQQQGRTKSLSLVITAVDSQSHAMLFTGCRGIQIWYYWSWLVQWTLHPLLSSPTSRPDARIGLTLFPSSVMWAHFEIWSWLWHQNRVLVKQDNAAWFLLQCCKAFPPGTTYWSLFWWSYFVVRTPGQYCVCVCVCVCGAAAG